MLLSISLYIKSLCRDFSSDPVVENLPSNAGDKGSVPGGGTQIPLAMEQRNPLHK